MEQGDYLVRYLRRRGVPEVRKTRREYLSHYGLDQEYVYVLVSGVVKASVTLREGTRFNISYIQGPCPVSLLRDEVSSRAKSPYSVRVESREAAYMAVPRVAFWEYVNEDPRLLAYVKDYYRANLEEALYRMRYLTMNGKAGAVGGFLYDLSRRFGARSGDGTVIELDITNEDIAHFCGISSRTSVNRILRGFREQGIIDTSRGEGRIVVLAPDRLERYVMD